MSIKNKYKITLMRHDIAMRMITENHYLHRVAPASFSFGLYEIDADNSGLFPLDKPIGVICYGSPASQALCKGVCGYDEKNNVLELTRLWIDDCTPKNAESFLIGNTIKLVGKEILVSFAEINAGHIGIVYQATNWIYTGKSDKHCQWLIEGKDSTHSRHIFDQYGGVNKAKIALGNKMIKINRPQKHRYIYFNCNRRRKRELLEKLRYPILPYPKHNGLRL